MRRFVLIGCRLISVLVVLCAALIVATATQVWWVARGDTRNTADTILVLGAAQYDGRPSAYLQARLAHAEALWRAGVAPRIVTVGGRMSGDRFTEAESGQSWLQKHGIPASSLVSVPVGHSTLTSLEAAALVLRERGWDDTVIVTDPWHALRSRTMAGDLGLRAEVSPVRSGPAVATRETQLRYIARETVALLAYQGSQVGTGLGLPVPRDAE